MTKPRKPATKKAPPKKKAARPSAKKKKETKRRIIAEGLVAGKTKTQIAAELGCTTREVRRVAAQKKTRFLVTAAYEPHHAKLYELAGMGLDVMERSMHAQKTDQDDYRVQLKGAQLSIHAMVRAQGEEEIKSGEDGLITWADFCKIYAAKVGHEIDTRAVI